MLEKKKEKTYKVVILLLAGISILMFFASTIFGMATPIKTESIIVWWIFWCIGMLSATVISIKSYPSSDAIITLFFVMFNLFCIISLSFLSILDGMIVIGIILLGMAIVEKRS